MPRHRLLWRDGQRLIAPSRGRVLCSILLPRFRAALCVRLHLKSIPTLVLLHPWHFAPHLSSVCTSEAFQNPRDSRNMKKSPTRRRASILAMDALEARQPGRTRLKTLARASCRGATTGAWASKPRKDETCEPRRGATCESTQNHVKN